MYLRINSENTTVGVIVLTRIELKTQGAEYHVNPQSPPLLEVASVREIASARERINTEGCNEDRVNIDISGGTLRGPRLLVV